MALVDTRTFESYASGDPIVVDPAKKIVAITGTPTAQSASAVHGAIGAKCHSGVVGGEAISFSALQTDTRSLYGRIDTAGAGTATLAAIKNGSTFLGRIRANPTGTKFELTDQSAAFIDPSSDLYTVAQDFRFDIQWDYAAGTLDVECRIFLGANVEGFDPDDIVSGSFASAAAPNRFAVGTVNTAWAASFDTIRDYGGSIEAWPVPYLVAADDVQVPVRLESSVGWTNQGGASSKVAALTDGLDTTYIQSASSGTSRDKYWLGPGITPDTANVVARGALTGASTGTQTVEVFEGADLIGVLTIPLTTTLTTHTVPFTAPMVAGIADWTNLYVDPVWVP